MSDSLHITNPPDLNHETGCSQHINLNSYAGTLYSYCLTADDQPVTHIISTCALSKLPIIYQQSGTLTGRHTHGNGRKQIVSLPLVSQLVNSPTLESTAHWAVQGAVGQSASTSWQGIIRRNRCFTISKEQAPSRVLPADFPTRLAQLISSK